VWEGSLGLEAAWAFWSAKNFVASPQRESFSMKALLSGSRQRKSLFITDAGRARGRFAGKDTSSSGIGRGRPWR
jgi:hypothetical protein